MWLCEILYYDTQMYLVRARQDTQRHSTGTNSTVRFRLVDLNKAVLTVLGIVWAAPRETALLPVFGKNDFYALWVKKMPFL